MQLENYVHKATGLGILKALNLSVGGDLDQLAKLIDKCNLDNLERGQLRAFLTQVQSRGFR